MLCYCAYVILYNYNDYEYSIVAAMSKKDEAFRYICRQERVNNEDCLLVDCVSEVELDQLDETDESACVNKICVLKKDTYHKFSMRRYETISNYVILQLSYY